VFIYFVGVHLFYLVELNGIIITKKCIKKIVLRNKNFVEQKNNNNQ